MSTTTKACERIAMPLVLVLLLGVVAALCHQVRTLRSLLESQSAASCEPVAGLVASSVSTQAIVTTRRLAQKRGKPTHRAARRDAECVQIPANPNQPAPALKHAHLDPSSALPFDLTAQRELYCKWYFTIGSGYHACKSFPSPVAACTRALQEAGLLTSSHVLAAAVASLSTKAILIIGDSTMLNK